LSADNYGVNTTLYANGKAAMTLQAGGNVGVGRTDPQNRLDVSTQFSKSSTIETSPITISTNETYANNPFVFYMGLIGAATNISRVAVLQTTNYALDNFGNIAMQPHGGNVGIGTTNPQAKLEINGNLRFTADGSVQTTAWTGTLCGGDYAESVKVSQDLASIGPGDALVVDPNNDDRFLKSAEPYSTAVMGVYSTKPGVLGRHQEGAKAADEIPMAMVGIVPAKVSAENGPIHRGDLLVTSSTPGYLMKGTDRTRMLGAVVGKALGRLDTGTGVIEVGVTLQ
jgi:hypothetical protein